VEAALRPPSPSVDNESDVKMRNGVLSIDERLRWLAVVAGVAMVAAVVVTARVPRGTGLASADVVFIAAPTGELGVSPVGAFLTGTGLVPASESHGHLSVTNQTGKRLAVLVRALPESRDLDDVLQVEIASEGTRVFEGTLGDLRRGADVAVGPGVTAPLDFRAWLPETLRGGYQGRVVSVSFDLGSRPADA
jgi:hypothetical protein